MKLLIKIELICCFLLKSAENFKVKANEKYSSKEYEESIRLYGKAIGIFFILFFKYINFHVITLYLPINSLMNSYCYFNYYLT